ncbi:MAG TPA: UDP-N-acetylglucosamine 1-carboxyvinyltransferase [Candidatus Kaiserbacteria bacterium]|nr:UDP-N-acetylglucosamine 1-carboxyvinyltransferase [Candidatus Kaiserbacteria bacterium]
MRESLFIKGLSGEKKLRGEIRVNTAKNAVLKAMVASVLFEDEVTLIDVPNIEDVERMAELLNDLGVNVRKEVESKEERNIKYHIKTNPDISTDLDKKISERLRTSIVLAGPLLSRFGKVSFPHPGGCVIGARPIDFFLDGFKKFGAEITHDNNRYEIKVKGGKLKGANIFFRTPTHTGTETMMMTAVLAEGKTILKNCAMEPEIKDLADFLNLCGAQIIGAGTSTIEIEGGDLLRTNGKEHKVIPDRIETGSFLILGALCADELIISNCNPLHVEALIELLRQSGVLIDTEVDRIILKNNGKIPNNSFKAVDIKTHEYPGFATDLQAPMVVYLTQVSGESLVHETIFEGRLNYTDDLVRMGADIVMWDPHRVRVKGPASLVGRTLGSPDLRAGLAFVIAAAVAKGNSLINNVYYIDRGYERIEERLAGIGLDITRTDRVE